MSEQAPANWYPDGQGNERYWDGTSWTEHVRMQGGDNATIAETQTKKDGAFAKLGAAVKKASADKQAANDDRVQKHAAAQKAAGELVTSAIFGDSTVEVYAGGYVRVAAGQGNAVEPARITKNTPFEKLRSIKFTQPTEGKPSSMTAALEGAVGPAVAGLVKGGAGIVKGGAGLMKASVPGLAVAGIAHLAGAEGRKSFLTVATDKAIHTLSNQSNNGFINKINKGHNEVGLALEAAANSVLTGNGVGVSEIAAEDSPELDTEPSASRPAAAGPSIGERLREVASLHADGILSDEEFTAVKAKLLSSF